MPLDIFVTYSPTFPIFCILDKSGIDNLLAALSLEIKVAGRRVDRRGEECRPSKHSRT